MWKWFSRKLLRNKISFSVIVALITIFMAFHASKVELSYSFSKILPSDDSVYITYQNFKKKFGEDGSVMVLGIEDKNLFKFPKFKYWHELAQKIKSIDGVKDVLSISTIYKLEKNDSLEKYDFVPLVQNPITSQLEVDSLKKEIYRYPFYEGIIYNKESGANLIAITFTKKDLDSKHRLEIVDEIEKLGNEFGEKNYLEVHYSGLPYIRTALMAKVRHEMSLFSILAVCVTAIILWLFFRSVTNVLFSLGVVIIGVIWSFGMMHLFNYKITMLSSLVASITMIIGLPNCIFLINKFQQEFSLHGNKIKSLARTIETIGVTLFLANITTAIGFAVLYFTKSQMLVEFGIVSAVSVMTTYFITLVLVPIILNVLPNPKHKHIKHQEGKLINKILDVIDYIVQHNRTAIYGVTTFLTILFLIGMKFINMNGYVVDDLPERDKVNYDLKFFEKQFGGVLPFEIMIDTKEPKGAVSHNAKALYKIRRLEKMIGDYNCFSSPVSVLEAIKFAYQTYKGGQNKYYKLPGVDDLKKLSDYNGTLDGQGNRLKNFIDSNKQVIRVSFQCADVGSKKMKELMRDIKIKTDSIFNPKEYEVKYTGHSLTYLKSNDYLLDNLLESLIIEIVLIALVGIALFRSVRIIVLSKLPCLIPLVITAGVMGFMDIRFKPSTILIFSIAFGISSDGTIYFLTKYRQELKKIGKTAPAAISAAIHDTGLSMIYTCIILFCGFAIFTASSFGGTQALGILVSLTLLMSMFTNLILLPAILLSIHHRKLKKEILEEPLIELE